MIKEFNSIRGTRIVHQQTGQVLAMLNLPIIDPDTGVIEAFWVKPFTLMMRDAVLLTSNILDFKKKIYIESDAKISDPADIIRIAQILEDGRRFLDSKVEGLKGNSYGHVFNFSFSTDSYVLRRIFTRHLFLGFFPYKVRMLPYDRILQVLAKKIVVDDDTKKTVREKVKAIINPPIKAI